jgi:thioredoxin 1
VQLLNRLSKNIDRLLLPLLVISCVALVYYYLQPGGVDKVALPQDNAWFQTQVVDADGPVVVKFGAEWCGPCLALDKVISQYERQPGGVNIVKVDVDERQDLASHYNVSGIPKVIMFKQGQPVAQFTGSRPLDQFSDWIDKHR